MARTLSSLAVAALCATAIALPQTREKKPQERDFPAVLDSAKAHFEAGRFADCMSDLKTCTTLAQKNWIAAIRAALPAAPQGWTKTPPPKEDPAAQAMLAGLSLGVGTQVEQVYTMERKKITVTVAADSPMISMMGMLFANPAMRQPHQELIEYGSHKAILDTSNANRLDLQILISGKHLVQVHCPENDEFLFAMFDQTAVDNIAAALGV